MDLLVSFLTDRRETSKSINLLKLFLLQLKEDICEPIATRYFRDITGTTTGYENDKKVSLPHHTLKHQYYE